MQEVVVDVRPGITQTQPLVDGIVVLDALFALGRSDHEEEPAIVVGEGSGVAEVR